jgi:hypothetical protein
MWRLLALIFGIVITSWGIVFNVISFSYFDFNEDLISSIMIIITRIENYLTLIGILLLTFSLRKRNRKY